MTLVNAITSLRIIGTFLLIFTEPLSKTFFIIYSLSGFTDVLDGYIARKTHTETEFGAKLDSVADLLFYGVMIYKLFPVLWDILPIQIWYGVLFAGVLRIISYIITAVRFHRFMSNHTYLNKITGFFTFLTPYFLKFGDVIVIYCTVNCFIVIAAAVHELIFSVKRKD